MLFFSCLTMTLDAAVTALSPNVWAYSDLRFISGMDWANVPTSSLALATEVVGKRWRNWISILSYFFPYVFMSLPVMAYLGRGSSWRNLYLWISVPFFCYAIAIYFLVRESPRWLLVRGQRDEAIKTLKCIARPNTHDIDSIISDLDIREAGFRCIFDLQDTMGEEMGFQAVIRRDDNCLRSWDGEQRDATKFGEPRIQSLHKCHIQRTSQSPFSSAHLLSHREDEEEMLMLVFTAVSSLSSILCIFTREGWQLMVKVVSFFSAVTVLNVLLIYTIELFPTSLRTSAISMVRQALILGAAHATYQVAGGRKESLLLFGVYGLVTGCCGLFMPWLPETRGRRISETIEEEEYKESVSPI